MSDRMCDVKSRVHKSFAAQGERVAVMAMAQARLGGQGRLLRGVIGVKRTEGPLSVFH